METGVTRTQGRSGMGESDRKSRAKITKDRVGVPWGG